MKINFCNSPCPMIQRVSYLQKLQHTIEVAQNSRMMSFKPWQGARGVFCLQILVPLSTWGPPKGTWSFISREQRYFWNWSNNWGNKGYLQGLLTKKIGNGEIFKGSRDHHPAKPSSACSNLVPRDFSNEVGHVAVTQKFNMHAHLLTYDSESTHSLLISIPEVFEESVYFKGDRGSKIKSNAFSQRGRDSESLIHLMSLRYNNHVLMSAVWSPVCLPTLFSAIWLRSKKITVGESPKFRRKHGKYCANRLVNTGKKKALRRKFFRVLL